MSAVFIAVPIIAWPFLIAGASVVADALGYTLTKKKVAARREQWAKETQTREVEWEVTGAKELAASVGDDEEFTMTKEGITLTFRKTALGKCSVCVSGMMSDSKLREEGERVLNQIKQQVVKRRVGEELTKRGYETMSEEQLKDGTLRIKVRKWS